MKKYQIKDQKLKVDITQYLDAYLATFYVNDSVVYRHMYDLKLSKENVQILSLRELNKDLYNTIQKTNSNDVEQCTWFEKNISKVLRTNYENKI